MSWVRRFRWRLARVLAPVPIMAAPGDGKEGIYVVHRGPSFDFVVTASRFRMRQRIRRPVVPDGADVTVLSGAPLGWDGPRGYFVGTYG